MMDIFVYIHLFYIFRIPYRGTWKAMPFGRVRLNLRVDGYFDGFMSVYYISVSLYQRYLSPTSTKPGFYCDNRYPMDNSYYNNKGLVDWSIRHNELFDQTHQKNKNKQKQDQRPYTSPPISM